MSRLRTSLVAPLLCSFLWSSAIVPSVSHAAAVSPTVSQTKLAGSYKLVLKIGPLEQMYTPARVKKLHPKTGEVMLRGTMVMGGTDSMGMKTPMPNHHLELHVYDRTSGKTIDNAMVALTVETSTGKVVDRLPIAVMYGLSAGMTDLHYGNNVLLKNGKYQVVTMVNHTNVTFMVTIGSTPKSSMSGM